MDKMVAGHSVAAWKKSGIGALVGAIVGAGLRGLRVGSAAHRRQIAQRR